MTASHTSSSPASPVVRLQREGDVALVRLCNVERLNPFTVQLQTELRALLAEIRQDRSLRAMVLAADGRAFCVGADLSSLGQAGDDDQRSIGERASDWMRTLTATLVQELHEMPMAVVSAVNGACAGGGVGLALAADMVLMGRSAYLYLPFISKLGIVPDVGSSWFLPRMAGRGRALGLALTGERLSAEKAVQWGLVWACVDDDRLRAEALALAHQLAQLPAHGALEARRAFDAASRLTLHEQLLYEAARQRDLLDEPSFIEGVSAFLGKRPPKFPGR